MKRNIPSTMICMAAAILVLLPALSSCKKNNEDIRFTDFNPDLMLESYQDSLGLDLDQDGRYDIQVYLYNCGSVAGYGVLKPTSDQWELTFCGDGEDLSIAHPDIPYFHWSSEELQMDAPNPDNPEQRYGIRFVDGSNYYYGWLDCICTYEYSDNPNIRPKTVVTIDKMAFCTIPNYPLTWGQTKVKQ